MNAPSLGGILATRQGSLALALVCAICAAGVLVFALGRYKTHVTQPTTQATVLIASGEIAKGTTGTEIAAQKLYRSVPVAASQLAPGDISNAADLSAQSASATIFPGQYLNTSDFSTLASVSLALHNGTRGIEIATAGAQGAVDITNPGSRVDVWGKPTTGADPNYVLVASDVLVLKPATATPVTIGNQSVPGSTLVVEIPNAEVNAVLDHSASVYLTLRPGKSGAVPAAAATPTTTTTTTTAGAS
jgi:Flp pilus assembly protein CpaB